MPVNYTPLGSTKTTTSRWMKYTLFLFFLISFVVMFTLSSHTPINWKTLHTFFVKHPVTVSTPSSNFTSTYASEVLKTSSTRRFAIFACSIHSSVEAYSFYTPITASSWKRVGYETIVVFVGDFTLPNVLTARLNLSRSYLKHVGASVLDVQCNSSHAVKLSQLVRVFSGFLPNSIVQDDDDILTTDSDLMPLRASEYRPTPGTDGFIFNAFCCGSFQRRGKSYRMFPMGHIYLKKKVWRAMVLESKQHAELLGNATDQTKNLLNENAPLSFETISLFGRHEFKDVYDSNMVKGDAAWYMDQVLCSMLLTDYREKHKDLNISERGRAERLDRADRITFWNRNNFDRFGDAHLIHDTILQEHTWKIFNRLLKTLFNNTLVNSFNDYYKQYIIASGTAAKQNR